MSGLKHFFGNFCSVACSIYFWIVATLAYLIGYPSPILVMCLVLFVLDVITRLYSICVNNGGLRRAFMLGKISSRGFWNGFMTKVVGYFAILTIANFAIITPEVSYIGNGIASILYVALFFYESISLAENLRDAGFVAANGILHKLNKEKDKLLDSEKKEDAKTKKE